MLAITYLLIIPSWNSLPCSNKFVAIEMCNFQLILEHNFCKENYFEDRYIGNYDVLLVAHTEWTKVGKIAPTSVFSS